MTVRFLRTSNGKLYKIWSHETEERKYVVYDADEIFDPMSTITTIVKDKNVVGCGTRIECEAMNLTPYSITEFMEDSMIILIGDLSKRSETDLYSDKERNFYLKIVKVLNNEIVNLSTIAHMQRETINSSFFSCDFNPVNFLDRVRNDIVDNAEKLPFNFMYMFDTLRTLIDLDRIE